MRKKLLLTALPLIILGGVAFAYRRDLSDAITIYRRGPLPPETALQDTAAIRIPVSEDGAGDTAPADSAGSEPLVPSQADGAAPSADVPATATAKPTPTATAPDADRGLPREMNLAVPMVFQAPFRIWDEIHEDACEEASVLMVQAYLAGERSLSPEEMDRRIMELVEYQERVFGDFRSTDADQTVQMMREMLGLAGAKVLPVDDPDDIRAQVAVGRPVIIPAAGRLLGNPNFRHGGPLYHMLVIKGYTADGRFISHDPGTRLGENYVYSEATVMEAIHDWNGGDVLNGRRVMIVVE